MERENMLNRIKIVTSLLLVLAIFGLLQLTSGGLFFNALKHDKENFTVLQTIRQQQSTLNGSWVALLQTRNTLNRAGIRYMMDQNNIGSGATVNDLMQIASASLKQAEKNWADYEALPRDPRQNDAAALEIKRNYDIYHGALAELIQLLGAGKINEFFDQPTQGYQDGFEKEYVNYLQQNDKLYQKVAFNRANGMNLELWFQRFYQHLNGVPEVVVTQGITPMGIGEGPYNGKPNPHAWMSPDNALIYVDNIRDALVKYDPANAQIYQRNAEAYKQKITATLEPLRKQVGEIPEDKRWMVTSEGAFSYLARDLGLKELYLWPINADQQGTPQQVRKVIDLVKKHQIPAVFSESTVSDKPARQVARETDTHYGGVLYVDSLSAENGPVPTYIDLLNVTTRTLVQGIRDGMKE
jgi:manganese/iron transport system substrate-binding protein